MNVTEMQQKAKEWRDKRKALGLPARKTWAEKVAENPNSLKIAICAKCWDCCCGDYNPNPRELIGLCPVTDCYLWPHRPYQNIDFGKSKTDKTLEASD